MSSLAVVQHLTETYAAARDELADIVAALQAQIDAANSEALPDIRVAALRVAHAYRELHTALAHKDSAALFNKPRTRTYYGTKIGLQKQKGKVEFDDEKEVIERIRKQLPKTQAELLIRVTQSVHKPAVYDLITEDLNRLGIRVADDEDVPVIKSVDSDVDKMVKAFLVEANAA